MAAQPSERLRLIRLVHVAKRELQMDDDTYRGILSAKFNKDSAADLSILELESLIKHLKSCGFKVNRKKGGRTLATDAQSSKIRALWLALHKAEIVRDSSEQALAAFVKRTAKVDALQWLSSCQAILIIENLKKWCEREGVAL